MPNMIANVLKAEGLQGLPIFTKLEDGSYQFDFNKILPMPEELNVTSGSMTYETIELVKMVEEIEDEFDMEVCAIPLENYEHALALLRDERTDWELMKLVGNVNQILRKVNCRNIEEALRLGNMYLKNIAQYGFPTWYEWCRHNWGTKWNSFHTRFHFDGDTIGFETAWRPPIPVIAQLSKMYPMEKFKLWYADENIGFNSGRCKFQAGEYKEKPDKPKSPNAYKHFRYCQGVFRDDASFHKDPIVGASLIKSYFEKT